MGRRSTQATLDAADILLRNLLQTPKTRPGMAAAVASLGLNRYWVYAWVARAERAGDVCVLNRDSVPTYVLTSCAEPPKTNPLERLPDWMCPKPPPPYTKRRVYRLSDESPVPQEQETKERQCNPRTRTAPQDS
jgi:hypothetical protein